MVNYKFFIPVFSSIAILFICFLGFKNYKTIEQNPVRRIDKVLNAHGGIDRWYSNKRVFFLFQKTKINQDNSRGSSNIQLEFPTSGQASYRGVFDSLKLSYQEGKTQVFGSLNKNLSDPKLHNFASYILPTMNYIHSLPWKLKDAGLKYASLPDRNINGVLCYGIKVTFSKEIGSTPQDWYQFYFDKSTNRMKSVLFKEHAIENPGIFWLDFELYHKKDGILIPKLLNYYKGDEEGNRGKLLKVVELIEISFEKN